MATIQESSGNVFSDLGFEPEEALNLQVRSDLMIEISKLIEERGLTQTREGTAVGPPRREAGPTHR